jgi:hypothetical protein
MEEDQRILCVGLSMWPAGIFSERRGGRGGSYGWELVKEHVISLGYLQVLQIIESIRTNEHGGRDTKKKELIS